MLGTAPIPNVNNFLSTSLAGSPIASENARTLQDLFERISESQRLFLELKRSIRYDKLGVHQALLRIQLLWEQKRLVGSAQLLPLFDRVAKDETFLHMARERAANLADGVRALAK